MAEDAGLAPDAARAQPGSLAHQHRVALQAEASRLEHVRDRQQQLARVRDAHLDAREVLAVAPADDARDAIPVIAVLRRRQIDVARAVALDEPRRVVLEAKRRAVERRVDVDVGAARHPGHEVHRRAAPRRVDLGVAAGAAVRARVVAAQDVAADARAGPAGRARARDRRRPTRDGDGCVAPQCAPSAASSGADHEAEATVGARPENINIRRGEALRPVDPGRRLSTWLRRLVRRGQMGSLSRRNTHRRASNTGRGSRCSDCRSCTSFAASTRRAGGGRRRSASSRSARSPSASWRSVRSRSARSASVRRRSGSAGGSASSRSACSPRVRWPPGFWARPASSRSRRTRSGW